MLDAKYGVEAIVWYENPSDLKRQIESLDKKRGGVVDAEVLVPWTAAESHRDEVVLASYRCMKDGRGEIDGKEDHVESLQSDRLVVLCAAKTIHAFNQSSAVNALACVLGDTDSPCCRSMADQGCVAREVAKIRGGF